jgi:hypothetical protein
LVAVEEPDELDELPEVPLPMIPVGITPTLLATEPAAEVAPEITDVALVPRDEATEATAEVAAPMADVKTGGRPPIPLPVALELCADTPAKKKARAITEVFMIE